MNLLPLHIVPAFRIMSPKIKLINSASSQKDYSKIKVERDDKVFRGHIVTPQTESRILHIKNGCLIVDSKGRIKHVTRFDEVKSLVSADQLIDFGTKLIMPGLIDMHLHLPQVAQTGRSGEHLLKWLEKYIFPAEAKFHDTDHASTIARWFFDELLRNGTTTACVFTTIHKNATDAAFKVAESMGNRVIMGKVLMDVNSPSNLTEEVEAGIDESLELMEKWHGLDDGRLLYSFIPRFAVTSSSKLLKKCSSAWQANKGTYMHTHLAESVGEVEFVRELFPDSKSYVDVYNDHGLLGDKTIFAHSIHLDERDIDHLNGSHSSLAHCPSSNFFLKSGVFKYNQIKDAGIRFGLGSDVAAGPQMSLFEVMKDANYIQPSDWIEPEELFYRATLGAARALGLEDTIGSLEASKDADFIVVDPTRRNAIARDMLENPLEDILSSLCFLGDDRSVQATYIRAKLVFENS